MDLGYLPVFFFTIHLVAAQPMKYALVGQKGHLNPEIKTSFGEIQILWKHNGDKVVDFNGNEQQVFNPYTDRVTLDWHTAELEISGLRYEDSGVYELEVYRNRKLDRSSFNLKVIDKVSKPTVSCEILKDDTDSGESGKRAELMCSASSRRSEDLMKFQWSTRGNMQPGPNLTISLGDQHDNEEHNCTVSNPLSAETTAFIARDCFPETDSTAIIVGVCVSILAVGLILGLLLLFLKLRRAKPEEKKAINEEQSLLHQPSSSQTPQRLVGLARNTHNVESTGNQYIPVSVRKRVEEIDRNNEENRSGSDQHVPFDRKSTFLSPQRLAALAPRSDDTESDENTTNTTESKNDTDENNKPLGHQSNACTSPSAQPWSPSPPKPSYASVEGHQEEANLTQVSGEIAKITVGESDFEEKNESDTNINHPEPLSPEHKQEMATPEQNSEPKDSRTSSIPPSEDETEQEVTSEQLNIPNESQPEESLPNILSQSPNAAATEVNYQSENSNTASDSDSDNCAKDIVEENENSATPEQDKVPEKPQLGEADSRTKDSEEDLPEAEKTSAGGQTPEQVEKESHPADASEQEEEESHGDDQKEKNQQPKGDDGLKPENRDSVSPDSSMAAAPDQGDNSRPDSPSESSGETAGKGGEIKMEQPEGDGSEHEDKANSDQVGGKCNSPTEAQIKSTDSSDESHT